MLTHIVKRRGHKERYDGRKVYASIYSACLVAHLDHPYSEKLAAKVEKEINSWVKNRKMVTSDMIFQQAGKSLHKYSKDASFLYRTHRDVC